MNGLSRSKTLTDALSNITADITQLLCTICLMIALTVVQLHPSHCEERERAAYSGGAAALGRGQSGASCGHCSSQPGDGQKEQRPDR